MTLVKPFKNIANESLQNKNKNKNEVNIISNNIFYTKLLIYMYVCSFSIFICIFCVFFFFKFKLKKKLSSY